MSLDLMEEEDNLEYYLFRFHFFLLLLLPLLSLLMSLLITLFLGVLKSDLSLLNTLIIISPGRYMTSTNYKDFPHTLISVILLLSYALAMDFLKTSSWFVKEVIILDQYLLVIFTPYYEPSLPPWNLVANIMSSCIQYRQYQELCMFVAVCSLLQALTYLQ